jgi:hypothetical protein
MSIEPAPRRLRFSLRTLVSLVTIIAMAIVIALLYAELVPLREENRRLRDEIGELSIEDESKFHAILMPQSNPGEFKWKWRIWIPEGSAYVLQYASKAVPKQGFPQGYGSGITIRDSGEHWVEYQVFRDPESGGWNDMLSTRQGSISGGHQDWPDWLPRTGAGTAVGDTTRVFEPDRTIELARWHISQAKSSRLIKYPSAGYMIWFTPIP